MCRWDLPTGGFYINTISNLELFKDARKAKRLLLMNLTAAAVLTADWRENVHYFS